MAFCKDSPIKDTQYCHIVNPKESKKFPDMCRKDSYAKLAKSLKEGLMIK